ncbi:putative malonyl-CoA ACP transacylase (MT), mitochondrial [Rhizophagus clarus]|uniref:[acyl-carrier-protein] S-malonyltransferase n=1 Tax=Rhizophagus clarus TaxID=94130 RepID=A0A2Z6S0W1_9GLOM|nr:putative malonyl-CoA ACP transacylase (MT), mitochondrial [Rhizophagus clarus]
MLVCNSLNFLRIHSRKLLNSIPVRTYTNTTGIVKSQCAIVFPGQGAQYVGMGKDLYENFASARHVFDEANEILGFNLKGLVFNGTQNQLTQTENTQPAILATSVAILRVLESEYGFDIESACTFALGHSLGEYTALVATKALSLPDAIKLVRLRGESMTKAVSQLKVKTAMSALIVREENLAEIEDSIREIGPSLPEGELVELANINSVSAVISGTSNAVDFASGVLQSNHLAARALDLPVSAPFHCKLMQPAADMMRASLKNIKFNTPVIDVITNVTATPIKSSTEIPQLLEKQVTATIQWQKSIKYCKDRGINTFIVIGPARVLANLLKKEYPMDRVRPLTTVKDIQLHSEDLKIKQLNTL